jgi:hypothetical protein
MICTMGFGEDKGVHLHVCGPFLFLLHSCCPSTILVWGKGHLGLKIVTCKVEILCVLWGFCNSFVIGRNVTKGSKGFAYVSLVFVVPRYLGPHNFLSHCNSPPFFCMCRGLGFWSKMTFYELVDHNVFMRTLPISSETLFSVSGSLSLSISLCMYVCFFYRHLGEEHVVLLGQIPTIVQCINQQEPTLDKKFKCLLTHFSWSSLTSIQVLYQDQVVFHPYKRSLFYPQLTLNFALWFDGRAKN